jgi:hypothetical protein
LSPDGSLLDMPFSRNFPNGNNAIAAKNNLLAFGMAAAPSI